MVTIFVRLQYYFLWPGAWAGNCLQPLRQIQWLHLSPGMPMSIDFRVFVYIQPGPSDIDENLLLGIAPQWNTASWGMFEQSKPNMGYYVACWAFWVRLLRHFLCFLMKILMQITTNSSLLDSFMECQKHAQPL